MPRAQQIIVVSAVIVLLGAAAVRAQPATAATDKADALSEAARKGDAATVKTLLDEGVDVNTKFRYGATALSYACDRGHVEVVTLLLERGADANVTDTFYKATPLTWAVSPAMGRTPRHPEVVRLLLQHGAQGKEDALIAVSNEDAATTKVILDSGGLSAAVLSDALAAATRAKKQDIVTLLEQAGAKPRAEVKLDAAQLARYLGSYRGSGDTAQVSIAVTTADGRLIATLGGRRLTLLARDQSTFGVAEQPGTTLTFRLDQDKATAIVLGGMGPAISFTRVEEK